MKTDPAIYHYLASGPEAFRVLTGGLTLPGPYRFRSLTLKALERRVDGVLEPEGHAGPVYLVEFQGQKVTTAWYNLMAKVSLYGEDHPEQDVRGILVFLHADLDPRHPRGLNTTGDGLFQAVYLNHFLPTWLERELDNPYVAVFAPLVWPKAELRDRAPRVWQTVQTAELAPETRERLSEIRTFWLFERFKALSTQEIWTMLNVLTPLQDTRAYQEIFAEGEARGRAEGEARGRAEGEARGEVRGRAKSLIRLLRHRFGSLPQEEVQRIQVAPVAQLNRWLDAAIEAESLQSMLENHQS